LLFTGGYRPGGYAGGYGGYGGYASTVPTAGSMGPAAASEAPGVAGTSYKVPRGARYIGAEKETRDGKEVIIDRYAVPQRHVQQVGFVILYLTCSLRWGERRWPRFWGNRQVEKLIEETKQVTVMENRVVPETRTIQVGQLFPGQD